MKEYKHGAYSIITTSKKKYASQGSNPVIPGGGQQSGNAILADCLGVILKTADGKFLAVKA